MKFKQLLFAAGVLAAMAGEMPAMAQFAGYQQGDIVLVLWANGYPNVNYDLGNVSQFLNHTNGYLVQVTNWDPNVAIASYGPFPAAGGFLSVNFNLGGGIDNNPYIPYITATGETTGYPTANSLYVPALDMYNYGIDVLGGPASANYSVLSPVYNKTAYNYNPSSSRESDWGVASLNGSPYNAIPGALPFWQIGVGASKQLGTFQFTADGRLFFEVPPILDRTHITDVEYDGVSETDITFTTKLGSNYQLLETTNLALPLSAWQTNTTAAVDYPNGGTGVGKVLGDGNPHIFSDLNATNSRVFYTVESH